MFGTYPPNVSQFAVLGLIQFIISTIYFLLLFFNKEEIKIYLEEKNKLI